MNWLLNAINLQWEKLNVRVERDINEQREQEAIEKKKRQEAVRKKREERYARNVYLQITSLCATIKWPRVHLDFTY